MPADCKAVEAVKAVPEALVKFRVGNIALPVTEILVPEALVKVSVVIVEELAINSEEEATPLGPIWKNIWPLEDAALKRSPVWAARPWINTVVLAAELFCTKSFTLVEVAPMPTMSVEVAR